MANQAKRSRAAAQSDLSRAVSNGFEALWVRAQKSGAAGPGGNPSSGWPGRRVSSTGGQFVAARFLWIGGGSNLDLPAANHYWRCGPLP